MARLIPPQVDPDSDIPPGEELLFQKFQGDHRTSDWTVLHSLDVARHRTKPYGEIDFVVLIPELGVLCIEVKSHRSIRRKGGKWYFGRGEEPRQSPFRQVREAMHGLMDDFRRKRPDLSDILFWYSVCFPFVHFSQSSPEWQDWEVVDERSVQTSSIGEIFSGVLKNARRHLSEDTSARWFNEKKSAPSVADCRIITDVLRPQFEFYESPASRARRRSEEIKEYTEKQFVALDLMQKHDRALFTGLAGTGKTFLAKEAARRSAAEGHRTLFLCFNRFLAQSLQDEMEELERVTCNTLHGLMLDAAGIPDGRNEDSSFWNRILPSRTVDSLLEREGKYEFDRLILDEAQDLLKEAYLDVLDLLVDGGLRYGKWMITGDFSNQNIYSSDYFSHKEQALSPDDFLEEIDVWAPHFPLEKNCRNTPRVAQLAESSARLEPGYSDVLRPDTGIDPDFHSYSSQAEQQELLIGILEELYDDYYRPGDIVVLSPNSPPRSVSAQIRTSPWRERLVEYGSSERDGYVRYASIHAFKGLEAPAVIITDLESFSSARDQELFYVAASRSQERLIVLVGKEAREDLLQAVLGVSAS
jgi:hypothetical protein